MTHTTTIEEATVIAWRAKTGDPSANLCQACRWLHYGLSHRDENRGSCGHREPDCIPYRVARHEPAPAFELGVPTRHSSFDAAADAAMVARGRHSGP